MKEIIKIKEEGGEQVVSARELYSFLEVLSDFTTWCKRMFKYGFEKNEDFILLKNGEKVSKSNPIDYALTLDTAKEISMLQRNEKGKIARKYFIEVEKSYKSKDVINFSDANTVLKLAENYAKEQNLRIQT